MLEDGRGFAVVGSHALLERCRRVIWALHEGLPRDVILHVVFGGLRARRQALRLEALERGMVRPA